MAWPSFRAAFHDHNRSRPLRPRGVPTGFIEPGAAWGRAAELSVYLTDEVTQDQRAALERVLKPGDVVQASDYISKDEARARFKQTFGDLAGTIDAIGDNPLPASYEVRLAAGAG